MITKLLPIGLLIVLVSATAFCQFNGTGFSGGIGYGFTQGNTDLQDGTRFIARGFVRKGLTDNLQAEFGLASAKIGGDVYNTLMFPIDLRVNFSPFNFESWNPFVYAGYGWMKYKVEDKPLNAYADAKTDYGTWFVPFGVGLQFKFIEKANFEIVGGFNRTSTWDLNAYRAKDGHTDNYFSVVFGLSSTLEGGNPDIDGDGLTNDVEEKLGTDPKNPDTDGDGLSDGDEVNKYKTDPKLADSDKDGLNDKDEIMVYHTDPNKADTDGDGLTDSDEVLKYHTDPLKKDTDGDGLADNEEISKYHTDPLKVDTDGGTVSDGDEVKRGTDPLNPADDVPKVEAKAPEPEKPADVSKVEAGSTLVLEGIEFETNSAKITPASEDVLNKVVTTLNEHKDIELEVQGHTDNRGKESLNKKLSQKRAESVRQYLVKNGIDAKRLKSKGFGSTKPVGSNDTDEGRQKNRRIEFLRLK